MVMFFDAAYAGAHDQIHALLVKRLEWLSNHMKGPYLTGENFTVADAYLFVCLNWSPWIAIDLRQWPMLSAFMKRVAERPRVKEALQAEQLLAFEQDGVFFAPEVYLTAANRTGTPVLP
ncbi:glutathione S-transferase [Rhizobium sp. BK399]|nr:glutathione S-transferase [Rhizobium sp. BK399]